MKALIFSFFIYSLSFQMFGQLTSGNYQGTLVQQKANIQVPSTLNIQTNGLNVSGTLFITTDGQNDSYTLAGKKDNSIYLGTLTYKDGTVFTFKMAQEGNIIGFVILQNELIILMGEFQKAETKTAPQASVKPKANDGLNRDPNLIGKWYQVKTYTSGGVNSDTYLTFFPDGTMQEATRVSMISYGTNIDVSAIGELELNKDIQTVMNAGYRWFTQAGKLCLKAPDGKPSVCNSSYNFDGGYLFIQWTVGAKKAGYKRSN
ncbi:hypothetical protein LV89_01322 [Arcicella aurantiaca]|uniref:Lipocalin-like protein n=1 Tax=Arcicella aurantiaca TaxID=591202 RepID=A0A316EBW0_9BACT|nr:hypothetical protein [Arcicella aurantiaca]PWK27915.1 hypothetical protein LV89_01322 [Arcicella aurantiaca]